jgi:peptidoglycan/xylan/chitin deacetylase (PgdA/CDA1 family)
MNALDPSAQVTVPILMYHEVVAAAELRALEGKLQSSYVMTDDQFDSHLRALQALGRTIVGLDEVINAFDGGVSLPPKPVVITFDDGYDGNFRFALPILQRYRARATFFVVSRKMGDPYMMTWGQLREMRAAGMLVESHTASHPLLSQLDEAATRQELAESKQAIEQNVGDAVRFLSLPNGDHNRWYPTLAAELGYSAGCGSVVGFNNAATNRYMLKRIPIKREMTDVQLCDYVSGARSTMAAAQLRTLAKGALVGVLGKGVYDKIYNRLFGVEDQRKSSL